LIGPATTAVVPQASAVATTSPTSATNSSATTITIGPVQFGKAPKKSVVARKALPNGGSSTKFHQSKKTVSLKRAVAVVTKNAKIGVKQAKPTVRVAKISVKKK
jgi:hypothetical protein